MDFRNQRIGRDHDMLIEIDHMLADVVVLRPHAKNAMEFDPPIRFQQPGRLEVASDSLPILADELAAASHRDNFFGRVGADQDFSHRREIVVDPKLSRG
jgi:hypothetical protein